VWKKNHSDAVAAGRGKRKESAVTDPGGLAVDLKTGRKTVERRKLRSPKIGLAAGAESEIDTGTGTENALPLRELYFYLCLCVHALKL
jgi:hypothetical protein